MHCRRLGRPAAKWSPGANRSARYQRRDCRCAFSLVELILVIIILSVIASMAIPRLSRGSGNAAAHALLADLGTIRRALQHYAVEHGNGYPDGDAATIARQLIQYTSPQGTVSAARDDAHRFGPYLLRIPGLAVGENAGSDTILVDRTNSPPQANVSSGDGWVYNPDTGEFYPNISTAEAEDVVTRLAGDNDGDITELSKNLGLIR